MPIMGILEIGFSAPLLVLWRERVKIIETVSSLCCLQGSNHKNENGNTTFYNNDSVPVTHSEIVGKGWEREKNCV